MEWLECYIEAHEQATIRANILAGWRGAGLFPENMQRILQIPDKKIAPATSEPSSTATNNIPYFPISSPPNHPVTLQSTSEISRKNIDTPIKI